MGAYIEWKDGLPYPAYSDPYTPEKLDSLIRASVACSYELREWCPTRMAWNCPMEKDCYWEHFIPKDELRFEGMSMMEVGAIRRAEAYARGDRDAGDAIENRILGKPRIQVETLNLNMSYKDYVGQISEKRKAELQDKYKDNPNIVVLSPDAVRVVEDNPIEGL